MTLVAAYSFDQSDARDDSGRGHDGSLFNTPTFPTGKNGKGIQFASASSQYASIPDHSDFTMGGAWTVMCWVNLTTSVTGEMVSKVNQWWFSYDAGLQKFVHGFYLSGGGTSSGITTSGTVSTSTWYHVAGRFNGTRLALVLNGSEDNFSNGDAGQTMADSVDAVRFGTWNTSTEFLNGMIDDVRIYNSALSDLEIAALMNTPVSPVTQVTTKLQQPQPYLRNIT